MRIAATLAGAVLAALLMLPVAAHAESTSPKPRILQMQQFAEPKAAALMGEPQLRRNDDENAQFIVKKRKMPQFQTRFFGE